MMLPDVLLTGLGWALLVLGSAALAWFIAGDRMLRHGLRARRCPKCWYDLSHSPGLRCSECGFEAKRERQLHRARRRWRWVAAAAVLFATSHLALRGPAIRARGWWAAVPTTAFIPFFERLEYVAPTPTGFQSYSLLQIRGLGSAPVVPTWRRFGGDELLNVRFDRPMWSWQRWLFLYRASKLVEPLGAGTRAVGGITYFSGTPSSIAEAMLLEQTRVSGDPARPSSHARRIWDRIADEVLATPATGRAGQDVAIQVRDSLWHRSDVWRSILVWEEGADSPCIARLVSPLPQGGTTPSAGSIRLPADGVVRLRIQLTEPDPPRTNVDLARHHVLWETVIERRIEIMP